MSIGKEFIEKTKYKHLGESNQVKGLDQPSLELEIDKSKNIIDLPSVKDTNVKNSDLVSVIENRRSLRKYKQEAMSLQELSYLLWATQGVKEITARPVTLRNVPSAGARHAFETYLLINNVEGLEDGIYRYWATEHKLIEVKLSNKIKDELSDACFRQIFVATSQVTFIWVAVKERMTFRYGERGYRYLLLDAGHICQNLYLASESIGYGTCAIAAYDDDEVNKLLNLDGEELFVTYIAPVGKR